MRGLFELALKKGWPGMSARLLTFSKSIDKRLWPDEHPLKQFSILTYETTKKLEDREAHIERLRDMTADEIGTPSRISFSLKLLKYVIVL